VPRRNDGATGLANGTVLLRWFGKKTYCLFICLCFCFWGCTDAPTSCRLLLLLKQLDSGTGNINSDPLFVDPGSGYGTNHVLGVYQLKAESPCRNSGSNQSWMVDAADLVGKPRIGQGQVDRGAYEFTLPSGTLVIFY